MKRKYHVIGTFTLATIINKYRRLCPQPQAHELLHHMAREIAEHFPQDIRQEFMDRCTRDINQHP